MPLQVVDGAALACSFGSSPSSLTVAAADRPTSGGAQAATITDFAPMASIGAFGMCSSPSNPQVIAATAAALGVFTPQPCLPATAAPWVPGSSAVSMAGQPALHAGCTCNCLWAGVITVSAPGQQAAQS
jgi:hypothetical protein